MAKRRPSVLFDVLSPSDVSEKLEKFAHDNNLSEDGLKNLEKYINNQIDDLISSDYVGGVYVVKGEYKVEDKDGRVSLGSTWEDVLGDIETKVGINHDDEPDSQDPKVLLARKIFDLFFLE